MQTAKNGTDIDSVISLLPESVFKERRMGKVAYTGLRDGEKTYGIALNAWIWADDERDRSMEISPRLMLNKISLPEPNIITIEGFSRRGGGIVEMAWLFSDPITSGSPEEKKMWNEADFMKTAVSRCLGMGASMENVMISADGSNAGYPDIWQYRKRENAYTVKEFSRKVRNFEYRMGYGYIRACIDDEAKEALRANPKISLSSLRKTCIENAKYIMHENRFIIREFEERIRYGKWLEFYYKKEKYMSASEFDSFEHRPGEMEDINHECVVVRGPFWNKVMGIAESVARHVSENRATFLKPHEKPSVTRICDEGHPYRTGGSVKNPASLRNLQESKERRVLRKKYRMEEAVRLRKEGLSSTKIAKRMGVLPRQVKRWFHEIRECEKKNRVDDDDDSITQLTGAIEQNVHESGCFIKPRGPAEVENILDIRLRNVLADMCATVFEGRDLGVLSDGYAEFMESHIHHITLMGMKQSVMLTNMYRKRRKDLYELCRGWLLYARKYRKDPETGMASIYAVRALECTWRVTESHEVLKSKFRSLFDRGLDSSMYEGRKSLETPVYEAIDWFRVVPGDPLPWDQTPEHRFEAHWRCPVTPYHIRNNHQPPKPISPW